MKMKSIIGLASMMLVLVSCTDVFSKLNNPIDPKADSYMGYDTVGDANLIGPGIPSDGGNLSSFELTVTKVTGATLYDLRIALTADNLELAPLYTAPANATNVFDLANAPLENATTYYWQAKAKNANGIWGNWSEVASFKTNWTVASTVPRNGLVAEYLFDGNTNDTSGNRNHGTVNGATLAEDRFGEEGKAYDFDGVTDYISALDPDQLKFLNNFSISLWIKTTDTVSGIFSSTCDTRGSLGLLSGWQAYFDSTNLSFGSPKHRFLKVISATAAYEVKQNTFDWNNGSWQHLHYSMDSTSGMKIFVNGVLAAIFTNTDDVFYRTIPSNFVLGCIQAGEGIRDAFLDGVIDDVRIFNRALMDTEVTALYNEGGWTADASSQSNLSVANPGAIFTKYGTSPILQTASATSSDYNPTTPCVINDNGTYKMWYAGHDSSSVYRVSYATSTDGYTWTKYGAAPVLGTGGVGSFDASGIQYPFVIKDSSTYKMWYSGISGGTLGGIGYATSSDGINWTRYGLTPVLPLGSGWDAAGVGGCCVVKVGIVYHLYYSGGSSSGVGNQIGHATSNDGISWIKDSANPIMKLDTTDTLGIRAPSVIYDGTKLHMWYSGGSAWNMIEYASSNDGSVWTRGATRPVLGTTGTTIWDNRYVVAGNVIVVSGKLWIYYTGLSLSGSNYSIGLAQMLN